MLRKLIVVVCGGLVGCGGTVEPIEQVVTEPPAVTVETVEFDGRTWTATGDVGAIRPVVMWGLAFQADRDDERLLVGVDETRTGSAAKAALQVQRLFGDDWLAAGACEIIAANGERDLLTYWKDELHGERRCYLPDGTLHRLQNFQHGKPHGEQKIWFENGQLWEHSVYMDGVKIQGRAWREDGTELEPYFDTR